MTGGAAWRGGEARWVVEEEMGGPNFFRFFFQKFFAKKKVNFFLLPFTSSLPPPPGSSSSPAQRERNIEIIYISTNILLPAAPCQNDGELLARRRPPRERPGASRADGQRPVLAFGQ